jgi:transcriptional antiterminator NusG
MGELAWYVVRSVSGQEKKVKEYLETEVARAKMVEFIPEILIPMEKVFEVRNGKKRIRERNFFPGYILVSADLSNGEVEHLVKSIPGVLGFLGDEGCPNKKAVPLRQSEVNRILGKVGDIEEGEVAIDADYSVGETIKVVDGPFSGFTGTIQEVFAEKKKLNVEVKIFGRSTPVELNYTQVEKEQ